MLTYLSITLVVFLLSLSHTSEQKGTKTSWNDFWWSMWDGVLWPAVLVGVVKLTYLNIVKGN